MTPEEYAKGFEKKNIYSRQRGIEKFSANNKKMLHDLEYKQRRSRSDRTVKFTKDDETKLNTLYKMADFLG